MAVYCVPCSIKVTESNKYHFHYKGNNRDITYVENSLRLTKWDDIHYYNSVVQSQHIIHSNNENFEIQKP